MRGSNIVSTGGLLPRDLLERIDSSDPTLGGLDPTDYGLVPGERVRDAVTRSWNRLVGVWGSFRHARARLPDHDRTATTLTRARWLRPLFEELGFFDLSPARGLTVDGKDYPVSHRWGSSVPVHLLGCRAPVDRRTAGVRGAARVSPHSLVQEFLNRSDDHLWGMVSNGLVLRVLRDNASLTRSAFCEFDLQGIFDGEAYSDFVLLWLTCHRTRFEGDPPEKCLLERWSAEAAASGTRALDRLREGVEKAVISLGEGFLSHRGNAGLRARLGSGALADVDYLRRLLRLVYRLIFLLVAESRDLLLDPMAGGTARRRYEEFYSVTRLRKLAARRRGTSHDDLWRSLQVTMAALDADHPGIPALGLVPRGSFLWSPDSIGDLARASIENRHLLEAMRRLSLVRDIEAKARMQVDYRNLGTRELGSVYESLLELHPRVDVDGRTFELVGAAGAERKLTGSYYTPESLISRLLDEALDPILDEAEGSPDPERALLDLKVLDPACGSGHFLISAAHRIAGRLATVRVGGVEPTPGELREALRDVVGRCLYGIDINPMAVELCKVSLWLEANDNRRPLGFLDHHIVCGNSLLGTTPELLEQGVPNEAFKALTGDDKKWVTKLRKTNRAELRQRDQEMLGLDWSPSGDVSALAGDLAAIDTGTEDTARDVAAKSGLFAELQESPDYVRAKLAADAWCAAFVTPKREGKPVITDATVRAIGAGLDVGQAVQQRVRDLAEEYRFIHPHLTFPDVFDHRSGGFDAVLGNPPWGAVKLQQKEWFATRDADIAAAPNKAARLRLIAKLEHENPALHGEFEAAVRQAMGISAVLRNSGRYPLCGRGDVNTYPVFAELMRSAISSRGRAGMIVPSGIATDFTYRDFFSDLVASRSLVSLYDFENRAALFPGVHRSFKFCLLSLSGAGISSHHARFAFFLHRPDEMADPERNFPMSEEDFALFKPNTRTCPIFRTRRDMEVARKMYQQAGALWKEAKDGEPEVNPWGVRFSRMFDMSNDSGLFRTREQLIGEGWQLHGNIFVKDGESYLPLYEAKLFHQYDHRFSTFDGVFARDIKGGKPRPVTSDEKVDTTRVVVPRYWVHEEKQRSREAEKQRSREAEKQRSSLYYGGSGLSGPQIALRQITRATDERTGILAMIPLAGLGHSGVILTVGCWSSGTSREPPTSAPPSAPSLRGLR